MSHTHRSPDPDTSRRNLTGPLRKARAAKHARLRPRQLRCEPLEDRRLLSVFTSIDPPKAIPDKGTLTSTISVPDSYITADVNVTVNVTHTRDEDLDVFLIAPDGTRVGLFTDVGGTGDHFTTTILDDSATTSITTEKAPFTGTFRPEGNLSLVEGKQVQGTWKLEVTDDTKKETGKLNSWSINVESAGVPAGNNFIDTNLTMLGNVGVTPDQSRKIVVSNNGDAMAVWLESKGPGDTGPWNAMAAKYVAGSWQTPVVIMNGNPSNVYEMVELAGDGFGNYLAVIDQSTSGLSATRYVNGAWRPAEPIGGGAGSVYLPQASMARGTDGVTRAVVAWCDQVPGDAKINRLGNFATGSWSGQEIAESLPPDPGVQVGSTDVAMAQNGDFMLVFTEAGVTTRDAYYRVYRQATGWDGSEKLLENQNYSEPTSGTQVVMNSSGVAMVSWRQSTGRNSAGQLTPELWARRWNGSGWDSEGERVSDQPENNVVYNDLGNLAINEQGEAVVLYKHLYRQMDGTAIYHAFVRHHDGTQWATTVNGNPDIIQLDLGTGNVSPPTMKIAMDDSGNAAAAWSESDGTYINVWASQFDGANWSTAQKLENAALDAVLPSVDMSAGVAQVIWTQSNGLLNHMYSATLSQPVLSAPVATLAALSGNDAALASMYDVPVKKLRIDTARRSESRAVESHTRDLSYAVGASANRLANDNVASDKHHTEVDDLFAQWDSDPLEPLSFPDLGA